MATMTQKELTEYIAIGLRTSLESHVNGAPLSREDVTTAALQFLDSLEVPSFNVGDVQIDDEGSFSFPVEIPAWWLTRDQ